jgi:hypothetical protein
MLSPEEQQNVARRQLRNSLIIFAAISLLALIAALVSFQNSLSLATNVDRLEAAVLCTSNPGESNCYQSREVSITGVDVTYSRYGREIDNVKFVDDGGAHEVTVWPGKQDSSVLRAGQSAVAILWRGRYTQLQVAATTFVTSDNPVGDRNQSRIMAWFGILFCVAFATVIPLQVRIYRGRWKPSSSSGD